MKSFGIFNRLLKKKTAYSDFFKSPEGEIILKDLYRFCKVNITTREVKDKDFDSGRREVYYYLLGMMHSDLSALEDKLIQSRVLDQKRKQKGE